MRVGEHIEQPHWQYGAQLGTMIASRVEHVVRGKTRSRRVLGRRWARMLPDTMTLSRFASVESTTRILGILGKASWVHIE